MGSNRFRVDMPRYIDLYLDGRLKLDELVSRRISLDEVNDGFDAMKAGEVARSVIMFDERPADAAPSPVGRRGPPRGGRHAARRAVASQRELVGALARRSGSTREADGRDELAFLVGHVVVVITQLTAPGPTRAAVIELALLLGLRGFVLWAAVRPPARRAVRGPRHRTRSPWWSGSDGDLEGTFFLVVTWCSTAPGTSARSPEPFVILGVAAAAPVGRRRRSSSPAQSIGWTAWTRPRCSPSRSVGSCTARGR